MGEHRTTGVLMHSDDLIEKTLARETLSREELVGLLSTPPDAPASYRLMAEATRLSKELSDGRAEVHGQLALNLSPCPCNCAFCSFAQSNGIFTRETELTPEEAVTYARSFEAAGANAIYVMATANYPFGKFLELSQEIRRRLQPATVLVANVGDQSLANARRLREAGFAAVYHALRLREGVDSRLSPAARKESIRNFQKAGLSVGTCVEPVGPEHTNEELADLIAYTASIRPSFSGAARRIAIPGTKTEELGMITELRMAQIVAITRLAMPREVVGHCTHEPCTLGAVAGANLFWAEAGANPRDDRERTEQGRGEDVKSCRTLFRESGWEPWKGASRFFAG
jgi:biotin synthase